MEDFIKTLLFDNVFTTVVSSIAAGIAGFFICKFTTLTKKEKARVTLDICQARETIFNAYERYIVEGHHISAYRYENLMELGEAYKDGLHQNHSAGQYIEELRALNPYLMTD